MCCLIKFSDSDQNDETFQVLQYTFEVLFTILFLALTAVVIVLIKKLRANNLRLLDNTKDSNYFQSEINTLSFILFFFAISFILRVAFDIFIGFQLQGQDFLWYQLAILGTIPFDLLPVFIVLCFHRRNLHRIQHKVFVMIVDSQETLPSNIDGGDEQ